MNLLVSKIALICFCFCAVSGLAGVAVAYDDDDEGAFDGVWSLERLKQVTKPTHVFPTDWTNNLDNFIALVGEYGLTTNRDYLWYTRELAVCRSNFDRIFHLSDTNPKSGFPLDPLPVFEDNTTERRVHIAYFQRFLFDQELILHSLLCKLEKERNKYSDPKIIYGVRITPNQDVPNYNKDIEVTVKLLIKEIDSATKLILEYLANFNPALNEYHRCFMLKAGDGLIKRWGMTNAEIDWCQLSAYITVAKVPDYIEAPTGSIPKALVRITNLIKEIEINGSACQGEDVRTFYDPKIEGKPPLGEKPPPLGDCDRATVSSSIRCKENGICSDGSNVGFKFHPVSLDIGGMCTYAGLGERYTYWKKCASGTIEGPRGPKPGPKWKDGPTTVCVEDHS